MASESGLRPDALSRGGTGTTRSRDGCGRFGRYANKTNLLSGHGRFLLGRAAAAAVFDGIASTVRAGWHTEMRRAGASERDCEAIGPAFLYDGLFYENVA